MTVALSTDGFVSDVAAASSSILPSLANPVPADGSQLNADRTTARHTPVAFNVQISGSPVDGTSPPWCVWVKYANDERGFVVYDSVTGFLSPFYHQSTWVAVTALMTLLPDGGWQDDIEQICIGGQSNAAVIVTRNGAAGSDPPPNS